MDRGLGHPHRYDLLDVTRRARLLRDSDALAPLWLGRSDFDRLVPIPSARDAAPESSGAVWHAAAFDPGEACGLHPAAILLLGIGLAVAVEIEEGEIDEHPAARPEPVVVENAQSLGRLMALSGPT